MWRILGIVIAINMGAAVICLAGGLYARSMVHVVVAVLCGMIPFKEYKGR